MNIRELIGEEVISHFFAVRYINKKLQNDVPDGVYDDLDSKCRFVIIDKTTMYIMSSMWIDNGGPAELPDEITKPPFGSFPDIRDTKNDIHIKVPG